MDIQDAPYRNMKTKLQNKLKLKKRIEMDINALSYNEDVFLELVTCFDYFENNQAIDWKNTHLYNNINNNNEYQSRNLNYYKEKMTEYQLNYSKLELIVPRFFAPGVVGKCDPDVHKLTHGRFTSVNHIVHEFILVSIDYIAYMIQLNFTYDQLYDLFSNLFILVSNALTISNNMYYDLIYIIIDYYVINYDDLNYNKNCNLGNNLDNHEYIVNHIMNNIKINQNDLNYNVDHNLDDEFSNYRTLTYLFGFNFYIDLMKPIHDSAKYVGCDEFIKDLFAARLYTIISSGLTLCFNLTPINILKSVKCTVNENNKINDYFRNTISLPKFVDSLYVFLEYFNDIFEKQQFNYIYEFGSRLTVLRSIAKINSNVSDFMYTMKAKPEFPSDLFNYEYAITKYLFGSLVVIAGILGKNINENINLIEFSMSESIVTYVNSYGSFINGESDNYLIYDTNTNNYNDYNDYNEYNDYNDYNKIKYLSKFMIIIMYLDTTIKRKDYMNMAKACKLSLQEIEKQQLEKIKRDEEKQLQLIHIMEKRRQHDYESNVIDNNNLDFLYRKLESDDAIKKNVKKKTINKINTIEKTIINSINNQLDNEFNNDTNNNSNVNLNVNLNLDELILCDKSKIIFDKLINMSVKISVNDIINLFALLKFETAIRTNGSHIILTITKNNKSNIITLVSNKTIKLFIINQILETMRKYYNF